MVASQTHEWRLFDLVNSQPSQLHGGTLLHAESMDIYQVPIQRGEVRPTHRSANEVLIYCVRGRVEVKLADASCTISAHGLMFLPANEDHELHGIDDSMLMIVNVGTNEPRDCSTKHAAACDSSEMDIVDEASAESFPASDPPSRTPITST